jgi:ketosteroid isomerase-like protein
MQILNLNLQKMKKILLAAVTFISYASLTMAQAPAPVSKVTEAEDSFNKLVARKGIKDAYLAVTDPEGIVFKPKLVKITDFYNNIAKQTGSLQWQPKFARISYNGDLAFTAGPYVYQNGKTDDDKVYGDYVSVWRADADGKLKLLINAAIQHPEVEHEALTDFKEPDASKKPAVNKDPFNGKNIIIATDKYMNQSLPLSSLAAYKEFLSPEGRFYFPGFEPMTGTDKVLKFLNNEAISITAENVGGGRSISNDLAYSYGRARITKGTIVSNYNYVRVWELDSVNHKWNVLLEVLSAIEI